MANAFPLDSAIVAAVISVVVTGIVILYKEHKLEPAKWKKDARFAFMEK